MITDLRNDFHQLIDSIENEELLEAFFETMKDQKNELMKPDIIDELTADQQQRLNESLQQIKSDKTISHKDALSRIEQWRIK